MEYSDKELENTYESLISEPSTEVMIWNAGAVYFDNEVVEYQGRHYRALCKTSAEVPGRSKHGIWKEIIFDEELSHTDISEYEETSYTHIPIEASPQAQIKPKTQSPRDGVDVTQKTVEREKKSTLEKIESRAKVLEEKLSKPIQTDKKPVNKPLSKKKTLKEVQLQKQALAKKSKLDSMKTIEANEIRTMQSSPSEQNIVNTILKEMEFKKIKGFNTDDNNVISNLILPQTKDNARLEWKSSHPDLLSSKGEVSRPNDGHDVAVNLSLTVSINKISATRFYTLWIKANEKALSDEECVQMVYDELDFIHIKGQNDKANAITHNLELLSHGLHDTRIFWASKDRTLLDERGHFYKQNLSKNTKLRLYAIISKGNVERLKHFDIILKLDL